MSDRLKKLEAIIEKSSAEVRACEAEVVPHSEEITKQSGHIFVLEQQIEQRKEQIAGCKEIREDEMEIVAEIRSRQKAAFERIDRMERKKTEELRAISRAVRQCELANNEFHAETERRRRGDAHLKAMEELGATEYATPANGLVLDEYDQKGRRLDEWAKLLEVDENVLLARYRTRLDACIKELRKEVDQSFVYHVLFNKDNAKILTIQKDAQGKPVRSYISFEAFKSVANVDPTDLAETRRDFFMGVANKFSLHMRTVSPCLADRRHDAKNTEHKHLGVDYTKVAGNCPYHSSNADAVVQHGVGKSKVRARWIRISVK